MWKHFLKWNLERAAAVSQLFGTVGAVDVLFMHDKALVGQGQRALLTIKAVLMPSVVLVVHHISPSAKTCKKHIYVGVKQEKILFSHWSFFIINIC